LENLRGMRRRCRERRAVGARHMGCVSWAGHMRSVGASLLLVLATAMPAWAEPWADLAADQQAIQQLETARAQTDARRATLERESQGLGSEIERLKAETAGVRRDLKLQSQLAAQKAKSDELER